MKTLLLAFVALAALTPSVHAEERACIALYQPVCAAKQVQCVRAPCYPQYQTYGNSCTMGLDDASFIHEGECTPDETGPVKPVEYVPPANCTAWFDGCNQCGRADNGASYCTLKACMGEPAPGYCTEYESAPTPAPTPAPAPSDPAPIATEEAPPEPMGFFASLWEQIRSFFSWF